MELCTQIPRPQAADWVACIATVVGFFGALAGDNVADLDDSLGSLGFHGFHGLIRQGQVEGNSGLEERAGDLPSDGTAVAVFADVHKAAFVASRLKEEAIFGIDQRHYSGYVARTVFGQSVVQEAFDDLAFEFRSHGA